LNLPRKMPPQSVGRIMKLEGKEDVRAMIQALQFGMTFRVKARAESLIQVDIFHPQMGNNFPFQIFLSTDITGELPFGSSIIKFVLPPANEQEEGEACFRHFQSLAEKTCAGLFAAAPFAGVIGYDAAERRHPLFMKGFHLFFGPNPEAFYTKIEKILSLEIQLQAERAVASIHDTRRWDQIIKMATELDQERHTTKGEESPLLNEVRPFGASTTLVDLR